MGYTRQTPPYMCGSIYFNLILHVLAETHATANLRCVKEWVAPPSEVLLSSVSKTRVPLTPFDVKRGDGAARRAGAGRGRKCHSYVFRK